MIHQKFNDKMYEKILKANRQEIKGAWLEWMARFLHQINYYFSKESTGLEASLLYFSALVNILYYRHVILKRIDIEGIVFL